MWPTVTTQAATVAAVLVIASAAGADAAVPEGNLLHNPGAEDGAGAQDASTVPPPGWTASGSFTAVAYGAQGFPGSDQMAPDGGANFFAGGLGGDLERGYQTIDVSAAAEDIDRCRVRAFTAGAFGGFENQGDTAGVDLDFLDANGQSLDVLQMGYPTAADRGGVTRFVPFMRFRRIPIGTRALRYTVAAYRTEGTYNDGYADNLSLTLEKDPPPEPASGPLPVAGQAVVVRVVRGDVSLRYTITFHTPGGACALSPEDIQRVIDQLTVFLQARPVIDARKGEVELTAAKDASGATQSGVFSRGVFEVKQKSAAEPLTELVMQGGSFARTCRRSQASAARRRVVRQLFGNARGRFRTRGRNSSATIRGTRWLVKETCAGTLTTSLKGTVLVRDFVKHRTRTLHSGESYLARPR
jgi:hypothetical protein